MFYNPRKKSANILTMKAKTVKTKKRQSLAKNGSKVPNCVTTLSSYKSGLRQFKCLKLLAGSPLAVVKGPGSNAPPQAELWPVKEGNHKFYPKIWAKVTYRRGKIK